MNQRTLLRKSRFLQVVSESPTLDELEPVNVDIRNVSRWFYSVNPQEDYTFNRDFPNLMIPFEAAVFEWIVPRIIMSGGERTNTGITMEYEALVGAYESNNFDAAENTLFEVALAQREDGIGIGLREGKEYKRSEAYKQILRQMEDRPVTHTAVFSVKMKKPHAIPIAMYGVYLDKDGRPIGGPQIFVTGQAAAAWADWDDLNPICFPLYYAISLLHCRNVELIDRPIKRAERRRAERSGKPIKKYKILDIDPLIRKVYDPSEDPEEGDKRPLHIVRGHFATYTEAAPLFGRITGTFWRPMHIRGSAAIGEVKKSYSFKKLN